MNKYQAAIVFLEDKGRAKMTCFGNSMLPILKSGSTLTFIKDTNYEIGDIVFCKVHGRYIDAHKITKKDPNKGYMIANNHGYENGWTKTIFGRAITAEYKGDVVSVGRAPVP